MTWDELPGNLERVECCNGKSCKTDVYIDACLLRGGGIGVVYRREANDDAWSPKLTVEDMHAWLLERSFISCTE